MEGGRGRAFRRWFAEHWDLLFLLAVWAFYLYHAVAGRGRE
jgi:hypothetical protein